MKLTKYFRDKIYPIFNQGLTTQELATSISIAVLLTTFPLYGLTTIALTTIAVKLKLNLPFTITVSYLMEPLRILLFLPFSKIGSQLSGKEHVVSNIKMIKEQILNNPIEAFGTISHELSCAIIGWSITIIPLSFVIYFLIIYFGKYSNDISIIRFKNKPTRV